MLYREENAASYTSQYGKTSRRCTDVEKMEKELRKKTEDLVKAEKQSRERERRLLEENKRQQERFNQREMDLALQLSDEMGSVQRHAVNAMARTLEAENVKHTALMHHLTTDAIVKETHRADIKATIAEQAAKSTRQIASKAERMQMDLTDHVTERASSLKAHTESIGSDLKNQLRTKVRRLEERTNVMGKSVTERVCEEASASEERAAQRHSSISRKMSSNVRTITSQAGDMLNTIIGDLNDKAQTAEALAESRHEMSSKQLEWTALSIETQNEAIKELRISLSQPSQCWRCFSSIGRSFSRCYYRRKTNLTRRAQANQRENLWLLDETSSGQNGAVILYGISKASRNVVDKLNAIFRRKNFNVAPTPYHGQMPLCTNPCLLKWIVTYAVFLEDQSTKQIREAIKKIREYLKNPAFQSCSKFVIIQCKWLPQGDFTTPLAALEEADAVIVQMSEYHEKVVKRTFLTKTSFDEVAEKLMMDAKVRPHCIFKEKLRRHQT